MYMHLTKVLYIMNYNSLPKTKAEQYWETWVLTCYLYKSPPALGVERLVLVGLGDPGLALAPVSIWPKVLFNFLPCDINAALHGLDASFRVHDLHVGLVLGSDPLTSTFEVDLGSWGSTASDGHGFIADDVVVGVWLFQEDWSAIYWRVYGIYHRVNNGFIWKTTR